ncbi:DJ-1/PfpI family protein [Rhodovulum kholense]|uniref:Protease I n=1 Tax=Rhodovulum kholense TaxID=453584 RepID=A0A8E2VJK1_9RHOB|nr:DJ-1/PfpI family protein [Rhodovulum kholense]PTW47163.1 protease I [Rhodovulum kholense]
MKSAAVLVLATDGVEHGELEAAVTGLRDMGARVDIATPGGASVTSWRDGNWFAEIEATMPLTHVDADEYDGLVLPGGQLNSGALRTSFAAVRLVNQFLSGGRMVAAICHAPWLLVEVGAISGVAVTSHPAIRTDLENAGARWTGRPVMRSGGIITARSLEDLDSFIEEIARELESRGKWLRRRELATVSAGIRADYAQFVAPQDDPEDKETPD